MSGGIAAYKVAQVASRLVQHGHEVQVIMTAAAAEFVTPLTFSALTGRAVGMNASTGPMGPLSHVHLAHWAEVLVFAPATADLLARLATGRAEDLLGLVYLGFRGPCLLAPAMESEMWSHPAIRRHVDRLTADGVFWVGPDSGRMASGLHGEGRLADPEEIVSAVMGLSTKRDLEGRRLLITAGATWEYFDPVRLLTNPATGTLGLAVARLAAARGAAVDLIAGPAVHADGRGLSGVETTSVVSADAMLAACLEHLGQADAVVATAAVCDFRPRHPQTTKAHKEDLGLAWEMEPTPDVLLALSRQKRPHTVMVGFAAETDQLLESAERKLRRKQLDWIVANLVGPNQGFAQAPYRAMIIGPTGLEEEVEGKEALATAVLDRIVERLRGIF